MRKITILLLLGTSIVSANELDVNKQLKKDVKVKRNLLIEQQENNSRLKQKTAALTETADSIAGIKKGKVQQNIRKLFYSNPLDGSQKIDKTAASSRLPFARYVDSTLLIENNDPKAGRNYCSKWLKKLPEGKKIIFSIWVKAENVKTKNIKFGIMIGKGKDKGNNWPSARIGSGSFDWNKVSFSTVVPFGVKSCLLFYGLQGGTGKVYFKDLKVEIIE